MKTGEEQALFMWADQIKPIGDCLEEFRMLDELGLWELEVESLLGKAMGRLQLAACRFLAYAWWHDQRPSNLTSVPPLHTSHYHKEGILHLSGDVLLP